MNNWEFSSEFDIYYNNIASNAAPGLDEYEKSVFLTKAEEDIVLSLYSGRDASGSFFEKNEETRRYLGELVKTCSLSPRSSTWCSGCVSNSSWHFVLPNDTWFITYEAVTLNDENLGCGLKDKKVPVIPISQDEYARVINNPYRSPNARKVIRLDVKDNSVEIVSRYKLKNYIVRYLAKPSPIILTDLPEGQSINGMNSEMECKLNPALHRTILKRAVDLAIAASAVHPINQ
jgi:hypothetical protein